jgi:hypothetical protein
VIHMWLCIWCGKQLFECYSVAEVLITCIALKMKWLH